MTTLVGNTAVFEGDDQEEILISADTIKAGASVTDPEVVTFLNNVVGNSCSGYFRKIADVFADAAEAAEQLNGPYAAISPCLWLQYYSPFAVQNLVAQPVVPVTDPGEGYYKISGVAIKQVHLVTFAIPDNNCWEYGVENISWYYCGVKPTVSPTNFDIKYCDPNQHDVICNASDGSQMFTPHGQGRFIPGSVSINYVSDCDGNVPVVYAGQGSVFVPIPPIPDGYPDPPPPAPLQGQLTIDEVSQTVAEQIVTLGGGFQYIDDVANAFANAEEDDQIYVTQTMRIPNFWDTDDLETSLLALDPSFWVEVIPPGTGGGAAVTLQAMIDAYNEADPEVQVPWLTANGTGVLQFDIVPAIVFGEEGNPLLPKIINIMDDAINNGHVFRPVVEVDYTVPHSNVTFSIDTDGAIKMTIKLGGDTKQLNVETQVMLARYCDVDLPMQVPSLLFTDETGKTYSEFYYKQLVLEKLDLLAECCNPCQEYTGPEHVVESFWGDQTSFGSGTRTASADYENLYRVQFNVEENNLPKIVYFGPPPLMLLAKFAWRKRNGLMHEIQYINLDSQTVIVPNDDITGFICVPYVGVGLTASFFFKNKRSTPGDSAPIPTPPGF